MSTVEQSIDVDVPVRTAYDQWTQFESFPEFMDGVERSTRSMTRTRTGSPRSVGSSASSTPRSPSSTRTSASRGEPSTGPTMPAS